MKATKDNAEWVSVTYEQQSADTDWAEWQGEVITPVVDLGYSQADSSAPSLYFDGWMDYSGDTLLVEQSGVFQQEVMPAGSLSHNISGASYDSASISVSGQDIYPYGIAFSPDGTKMFVLGGSTDRVYQYTLTTGFDLSTASYDSVSLSVSGQDSYPYGIAFSPDGTKMFMVGVSVDRVYQYTLTTGFDLSTASYDSIILSVAGQDGSPRSIAFSPDGTKMYMGGSSSDTIYQYNLTTGFDLSTASYSGVSLSLSGQGENPYGIAFSPDGTKMFVLGGNVLQYTLTTGFDLSTASYDSVSFVVGGQDSSPYDIAFSPDGTKMFMVGGITKSVHRYTTNFSSTYSVSLSSTPAIVTSIPNVTQSVTLASSEDTCFVTDKEFPAVSATTTSITLDYDNDVDAVVELGDYVGVGGGYDLSSATYDSVSFNVSSQDTSPYGLTFLPDGTKMFVMGGTNDTIYQYSLSTPWDISTASYDSVSFSVSGQTTSAYKVVFSSDGGKMFVLETPDVLQYSLSTPWDISTASYDNVSFSTSSQEAGPFGLAFSPDGTKMFVVGNYTDTVYRYSLSTAWDLSTVSYDNLSFGVGGQDLVPYDVYFSPSGTKMFVLGSNSRIVYQYSLSTAWDISTASYDNEAIYISWETSPRGIAFSSNGTKMFVIGISSDSVYQYSTDIEDQVSITDITVSNTQTTLSFVTQSFTPTSCILPDWSTEAVPIVYTESNGNIVQRSDRNLLDNGKRFAKFKLVGDTDEEVVNAKINLWKEV